ncbi:MULTISPECIES: fumarylacetoacetate hydrolase family protein [Halomonas]|uniref:Fumarylacetoacetase-like C-terminal domain-containing protein n=2 Tax=Halomonas TaxID=2745 RepID=A0ABQ0U877_9GAMM|nr:MULTISPECIES: fumarylacetoacetate hydrolase family protein [Halomonas]PSJ21195.1 fumarylacetoacetate hydrolase family protein [Halomonas sp. ND22Bw]KGE78507.1 5-carboxymethyl-2-hydroxymuconate delta-isomerase [Halomonas salina]MDR5890664.1 fumarylacetoacetate hydrolase family protein [Halomonas salina]RAH37580.1 fumarylacetoacetate hydrolase family protein [Halomonas sp. SL1]WJY07588.1 fumarylacetoacetate hydrolase family protein [Halomonas halophila]
MRFIPRFTDGRACPQPLGKIVCVGRNYAEHARELDNPVPSEPLLFIKPATSAVSLEEAIDAPFARGEVHFETELALLVGETLKDVGAAEAERAIVGIGLALDLTLRDVQGKLKEKGHPWEVAKGFDGACPMSAFLPLGEVPNWSALAFTLAVDGEERQHGHGADMLFPVPDLVAEMSRHFTLEPGDVVLTGTPAGVGELPRGAELRLSLTGGLEVVTRVVD